MVDVGVSAQTTIINRVITCRQNSAKRAGSCGLFDHDEQCVLANLDDGYYYVN